MKFRCKRWMLGLTAAILGICGCRQPDGEMLRSYRDEIAKDSYNNSHKMFRHEGLAEGICVIEDESVYYAAEINASSAVCFNITQKETLYSKAAFERFPVASLTKLMTALLALKYGDLDQTITLTEDVVITTYDAWLCGFKPNDQVSLRDLLKASLVYSGNDASAAIATAVGGTQEHFVSMMNSEAKLLGATDTNFANSHGLDQNNHYSTAYDIYLIFNECLKYPEFRQIIPLPKVSCTYISASGEEVIRNFPSGNGYLNKTAVPPETITVFGGKTGHTEKAGYCLATLAKDSKGDEYIAVVLGAETKPEVYAQTNLLLDKIP